MTHGCDRHEPSTTCYVTCRCRCDQCRAEIAAGERRRVRRQLEEKWGARPSKWVDPGPVREHVRSLMASEVGASDAPGWTRIADRAGVSRSTVCQLLYGKRGTPIVRMLRRNAEALLAVDSVPPAGGQVVDPVQVTRLVETMVSEGWSKAAIGAWVHRNPDARALQLGARVTAATAARVLDLARRFNTGQVGVNQRPTAEEVAA